MWSNVVVVSTPGCFYRFVSPGSKPASFFFQLTFILKTEEPIDSELYQNVLKLFTRLP